MSALPGAKPGEPVWCGVISVHKDLSAPFWRDYVRRSVREILKQGMDGVWCDNFSPWDNFGYPPVGKAFGDWSAHGFGRYLAALPAAERTQLGAPNPAALDVRRALKARAGSYGAKDPSVLDDAAWRDRRWLSDPLWSTYKAYRQEAARRDLRAFYQAIHDEARKAGRPDFCIGGNDIPLYGLGWVRDTWLDMVNTETTPGWHMGAGARGITIPPAGKMAVVYRAAREHQKGPFTAAWYYLNNGYERYQRRPGIARVLLAEAFANGAFLMCDPDQAQVVGTVDVHAWWNAFVRRNEQRLGQREPMADTAVLFSPDCQLGELAPGGFPDMDRQPHVFGHWGWATALIDGHRPYRALPDWKVNAASLAGLRTLVVPDAEWLDEPVVRALEAWTRGGGHLVLTGMCGAAHGPAGRFRPRPEPALASLVTRAGGKLAPGAPSLHAGRADLGRVTWTAEPLGMDYYLDIPGRAARLEALLALVPASQVLDAHTMPTTVGIAPWLSADGETRYADLVNYALDTDGDRVTPATQLEFRVKAPAGWRRVRAETLTPDDVPPATAVAADGMVTVRLPRLVHYASVRLSGES